jgi:hypothetical protein
LKITLPIPSETFKLGAYGNVVFPTGNKERRFTTEDNDITILGLATIDMSDMQSFVPTRLHFNGGYRMNKNEELGYGIFDPNFPDSSGFNPPGYPGVPAGESDSYNDEMVFNAALEFPAPSVTFFVEFDMHKLLNVDIPDGANVNASTYTLTPGVEFRGKSSSLELGADINLNPVRYQSPRLGAVACVQLRCGSGTARLGQGRNCRQGRRVSQRTRRHRRQGRPGRVSRLGQRRRRAARQGRYVPGPRRRLG